MNINLQTVGADVEMFLQDEVTNEIISAEGFIQGSKDEPFKFDNNDPYYSTQLDNVLAEVTIPPVKSADDFAEALTKSINYVRGTLPQGISPVALACANLDEKYLMTEQAQLFGCEPDFNAYTRYINEKPWCEDFSMRSAGGHVHIGFDDIEVPYKGDEELFNYEPDKQRCEIVKVLDLFISIPLVLMEPDSKRKELYGKAGAFRPKSYGLEYRTPSNYYLNSPELMKWVYNSTTNAIEFLNNNGTLNKKLSKNIRSIIDSNNKDAAKELVNQFNLQLL